MVEGALLLLAEGCCNSELPLAAVCVLACSVPFVLCALPDGDAASGVGLACPSVGCVLPEEEVPD